MGSSPGFGSDRRDLDKTSSRPRASSRPRFTSPRALFRLGFPMAPRLSRLTSHVDQLAGSFFNRHAIRLALPGEPLPRGSIAGLSDQGIPRGRLSSDCLWATGFRFSFTPRTGVLFTFPSRYSFAIGRFGYLALERGRPCFPRDSSCPAVLKSEGQDLKSPFAYGAFTLSRGPSQGPSAGSSRSRGRRLQPPPSTYNPETAEADGPFGSLGLGSSPFARHYSGNLIDFLSSGYLDVSVPPLARGLAHTSPLRVASRVSPFGHPRIKAR
jgi:hypothetical protein